jgi:cytochrome c-type biogenesis protein
VIDIGYTGAFLGGILSLLSPCSAILLPAFFAYAFSSPTALLGRTVLFYAGLVTTLVPLGIAASSVGTLVTTHRDVLIVVMSLVVIALGTMQVLGVQLPMPARTSSVERDASSIVSVYLLGTVYGVAGVCSGPILGSVLAVAAMGSDPAYGGLLLAVYALGMVIPIAVLALLWDRFQLSRRRWLRPKQITLGPVTTTSTGVISGLLFIGIGALLLTTAGTANLGGVLTIDQEYRAESSIQQWSSNVSDIAAVLVGLAVFALIIGWTKRGALRRPPTKAPPLKDTP